MKNQSFWLLTPVARAGWVMRFVGDVWSRRVLQAWQGEVEEQVNLSVFTSVLGGYLTDVCGEMKRGLYRVGTKQHMNGFSPHVRPRLYFPRRAMRCVPVLLVMVSRLPKKHTEGPWGSPCMASLAPILCLLWQKSSEGRHEWGASDRSSRMWHWWMTTGTLHVACEVSLKDTENYGV